VANTRCPDKVAGRAVMGRWFQERVFARPSGRQIPWGGRYRRDQRGQTEARRRYKPLRLTQTRRTFKRNLWKHGAKLAITKDEIVIPAW